MKLTFLLYVPRSGSTLFAKLLAERYGNVMVLPELRLPKLLAATGTDHSLFTRKKLLDLTLQDHQFPSLGLTQEEVAACIDGMQGTGPEAYLAALAAIVAEKKQVTPEAVLFKCGSAGLWWPALRSLMPQAKFIHVFRDPRAVVNSALHTDRPYHAGQKMGRGDPWHRAQDWRKFTRGMRALHAAGEPVIEVRYEGLCADKDGELDRVAAYLAIERGSVANAMFAVAAKESDIHANVKKPPLPARVDAWQHELKIWQGIVVEFIAGEEMRRRGYEPWYAVRVSRLGRCMGIAQGVVAHWKSSAAHYLRRGMGYLACPATIAGRLRQTIDSRKLRSRW
jgi:hypothetical protein